MIFADKNSVKQPACFADRDSPLNRESDRAIAFFSLIRNRNATFDFTEYRNRDIKSVLSDLFNGKCCYCESYIESTQPVDIEHFRPKSMIIDKKGNEIRPGYYWLVNDWGNLLYACRNCNSLNSQEIIGGVEVVGKGNKFPIRGRYRNVNNHTSNGVNEENNRLLINPCIEDPEKYLKYDEDYGFILSKYISGEKHEKAQTTIDVIGLTRDTLTRRRKKLLNDIYLVIENIKSLKSGLTILKKTNPRSAKKRQKTINENVQWLQSKMASNEEFAGLARQLIGKYLNIKI